MNDETVSFFVKEEIGRRASKIADLAQTTSDITSELATKPITLDYNRVAARFYEDQILTLRKELQKYKAQVQAAGLHGPQETELTFVPAVSVGLTAELRARMTTPSMEAESTPEEL